MIRKNLLLIAAMALIPSFLIADEPADEVLRIPVRVIQLPNPNAKDLQSKARLEVLRAFQQKYPEIELTEIVITPAVKAKFQKAYSEIEVMKIAIAEGCGPDIININFRMSDNYIQEGLLLPLDDLLERDFLVNGNEFFNGVEAFMSTVPLPIRPVIQRKGPTGEKHVWAIPDNLLVRVLQWRKDVFAEAGLDPETPPRTWEELYVFAKQICKSSPGSYGIMMADGVDASWDFMSFLWSGGGEAVIQDENGEWIAVFNTEEAVIALDFYLKLNTEKWVDSSGKERRGYTTLFAQYYDETVTDPWAQGLIGMQLNYLDAQKMGAGTDAELIGIAQFPMGPTGLRGTEVNARMDGIFSGIQGRENSQGKFVPAEKIRDAAWKWLVFVRSKEAREIVTRVLVDGGWGRMLNPDWLEEFGYTEYLEYFPPEYKQTFEKAVRDGKPEPYGYNCQWIYHFMSVPVNEALQLARDGELPEDRDERLKVLRGILDEAAVIATERMKR